MFSQEKKMTSGEMRKILFDEKHTCVVQAHSRTWLYHVGLPRHGTATVGYNEKPKVTAEETNHCTCKHLRGSVDESGRWDVSVGTAPRVPHSNQQDFVRGPSLLSNSPQRRVGEERESSNSGNDSFPNGCRKRNRSTKTGTEDWTCAKYFFLEPLNQRCRYRSGQRTATRRDTPSKADECISFWLRLNASGILELRTAIGDHDVSCQAHYAARIMSSSTSCSIS